MVKHLYLWEILCTIQARRHVANLSAYLDWALLQEAWSLPEL